MIICSGNRKHGLDAHGGGVLKAEDMSAADVAGKCCGSCYEKITGNGILSSLIKKAKAKKGFLIEYSKKQS